MKDADRFRLLDAILASQTEGVAGAVIDEERIRQALTDGPRFSDAEKRILWLSPDTRALFLEVRREIRQDLADRVRTAGYGEPKRLLAASGDGSEERITGHGWELWIFHDDIPGAEWSLSLQLEDGYMRLLPPQTVVALKDSGGKTWLSGVADSNRQIQAVWEDNAESPFGRLKKYALIVEP
jgi:hypothetical protein